MNKLETKKRIIEYIKDHPQEFPFISKYWNIEIEEGNEASKDKILSISYGHYKTKDIAVTPFYKSISKIIF